MTRRWKRRAGIQETPVDSDLFLVLPGSDEIYHLNAIGAALWRFFAEESDEAQAQDALALAFPDMPAAAIAADIARFTGDLSRRGLLEAS